MTHAIGYLASRGGIGNPGQADHMTDTLAGQTTGIDHRYRLVKTSTLVLCLDSILAMAAMCSADTKSPATCNLKARKGVRKIFQAAAVATV
jgi:hypothetical protein